MIMVSVNMNEDLWHHDLIHHDYESDKCDNALTYYDLTHNNPDHDFDDEK